MKFNNHSAIAGSHAFLSPSYYHWLNYEDDYLIERLTKSKAAERGSRLHDLAAELIELGVKLVNNKQTLNQYVNDAIGYRMAPEQPLFYSKHCFGTADAISFRKNLLRIHDLKTGSSKVSELQLYIYAALFCREYDYKPFEIEYELRIYQEGEVRIYTPTPDEIAHIMSKIVYFDKKISEFEAAMEG